MFNIRSVVGLFFVFFSMCLLIFLEEGGRGKEERVRQKHQ